VFQQADLPAEKWTAPVRRRSLTMGRTITIDPITRIRARRSGRHRRLRLGQPVGLQVIDFAGSRPSSAACGR
jgi:hypothetical protein